MPNLRVFAVVVAAFLTLDFLWLGVLMKSFYDLELGTLARRHGETLAPRWGAAILVYLLIPAGIVIRRVRLDELGRPGEVDVANDADRSGVGRDDLRPLGSRHAVRDDVFRTLSASVKKGPA